VRFWAFVDIQGEDDCWIWHGKVHRGDYGYFAGVVNCYAHRFAYEDLIGPIPVGLTLDHLCRVPRCVNPKHLEPVTGKVNILRGNGWAAHNARKTHCKQGHPFDTKNTYTNPEGERVCCTCRREANRRHYHSHRV
jgi:hypothetical protein